MLSAYKNTAYVLLGGALCKAWQLIFSCFPLCALVKRCLQDAMNFEGSSEEKKAKALLSTLGIDYDAITMEQFVNLIEVLKLSKHLKTPISQRGKTTMTHGKGKRKKR